MATPSESGNINYSRVSRPFIIAAVVCVFLGTAVGSLWMVYLYSPSLLSSMQNAFQIHRVLQVDGFLTLLIMGIGYMIVPRFRNIPVPSVRLAVASFLLVLCSIIILITQQFFPQLPVSTFSTPSNILRFIGLVIFTAMILWTMRVRPRLLKMADYFIGLSVITLFAANALRLVGYPPANPMSQVQMWLFFPMLMIYGIEYKTLPSFLGFIRPRKGLGAISFGLAVASVVLGFVSSVYVGQGDRELSLLFNIVFLLSAFALASALYIHGGFDNSEILKIIYGEKKVRYTYTAAYTKLSFAFLYAGIVFAILFNISSGGLSFASYDLAIHTTAIGFIGVTIALYLPLMLPPVIGRTIHFTSLNKTPVILIVSALALRGLGQFGSTMTTASVNSYQEISPYLSISSGWLVLAALFVFVYLIHRSMKKTVPAKGGDSNNFANAEKT